MRKLVNFFESFIVVAILLVLVQTFLEDFAVLAEWDWAARRNFIISGFIFDSIFTIEFLIRYFSAMGRKEAGLYFMEGRGWIDFLASIPLLLLNSGPAFLSLIMGGGIAFGLGSMLNILKIVKAIRIARILRLLRILKIFRRIKHTGSVMAQRHITKINTISITAFVFTLFFFTLAAGILSLPTNESTVSARYLREIDSFLNPEFSPSLTDNEKAAGFGSFEDDLLIVKKEGKTLFSKFDNGKYASMFGPGDYAYFENGPWSFYFDVRNLLKVQSVYNILFFLIVVILVLSYLVYYSPHFAITVTDPIHVMRKGFSDSSYNLEVEIPAKYRDDDIFILSDLYNREYLALKQRNLSTSESAEMKSDLSLDDIQDLLE